MRALVIKADVSNEDQVRQMFETIMKTFGKLHIVVSNAGIEHFGALGTVSGDEIDRVFAVNVKGQFFIAQQAFGCISDFGRVFLTSSISAVKVLLPSPSFSLSLEPYYLVLYFLIIFLTPTD